MAVANSGQAALSSPATYVAIIVSTMTQMPMPIVMPMIGWAAFRLAELGNMAKPKNQTQTRSQQT
jgi:hypothetical protein